MIAAEHCALVLLAAGLSTRFGGSKLDADLGGRPLGVHVVDSLADVPFRRRIAVTGRAAIDYAARGFHTVPNADPAAGMGGSVRLGIAAAGDVHAALIVLADMPFVTAGHVRALLAAGSEAAVIVSGDGAGTGPPVLFGRDWFDRLLTLDGDAGARELIGGATQVIAPAGALVDVDTVAALAAVRDDLRRSP